MSGRECPCCDNELTYDDYYGRICAHQDGKVIGNIYKCDNEECMNPDHLELGTYQDNYNDAIERGRSIKINYKNIKHKNHRKGERCSFSKLKERDILEIRILLKEDKLSLRAIGRKYGVRHEHIRKIRDKEIWSHVPD